MSAEDEALTLILHHQFTLWALRWAADEPGARRAHAEGVVWGLLIALTAMDGRAATEARLDGVLAAGGLCVAINSFGGHWAVTQ